MKKIAVILSGCGVFDGSEIHEATLTLLAILKNNAQYECFAPDIKQYHVINHLTGEVTSEERNVLSESARIARGKIKNILDLDVDHFDAVIFPGGFGVAKNLSDFAIKEAECEIIPEVSAVIKAFWSNKKPIGAICISPVIIAKIIKNVVVTIGEDQATIAAIETMGAIHKKTTHGEIIVDSNNKIVTTPCYMLNATILQIETGVSNLTKKVIELI